MARDNLTWISKQFNFKYNKQIWKIISGNGAVGAGKRFTLFISNQDMNNINKIIKPLVDLGVTGFDC